MSNPTPDLSQRQQRGQRGEQIAADYLRQRGYQIVAQNWRCPLGELDIIAQQGATLVFVEVRLRTNVEAAIETVHRSKQKRLARLAERYLSDHPAAPDDWRVDVIAIGLVSGRPPVIDHREHALDW